MNDSRANTFEDVSVTAAAAEIAIHRVDDLATGRFRISFQKTGRGQDHARHAIPALHGFFLDKRLLDRVQLIALGEAFDRAHRLVLHGGHGREAGRSRTAVDQHRTGPALPFAAAILGAGQPEILPEHFEQRPPRITPDRAIHAVELKFDFYLHDFGPPCSSVRSTHFGWMLISPIL
jgi:hypothetical protein